MRSAARAAPAEEPVKAQAAPAVEKRRRSPPTPKELICVVGVSLSLSLWFFTGDPRIRVPCFFTVFRFEFYRMIVQDDYSEMFNATTKSHYCVTKQSASFMIVSARYVMSELSVLGILYRS